jgi:hypothetical protein
MLIWEHALPDPRVVHLWIKQDSGGDSGIKLAYGGNFAGKEHILTCHESRDVFLETYHRIKLVMHVHPKNLGLEWPMKSFREDSFTEYIDGQRDTLLMKMTDWTNCASGNVNPDLRRIEIWLVVTIKGYQLQSSQCCQ